MDGGKRPAEEAAAGAVAHAPVTRLIVKNLPKYTTEAMLRKHFGRFALTDLRMMRTSEGRFRRFAYLGFASARDARACCKHFHNTFFDTSRMDVEEALPFGDASLPRAWSRHSHDSSAFQRTHGALNAHKAHKQAEDLAAQQDKARKAAEAARKRDFMQAVLGDAVDPAEFGAFLQAMRPKSKTKTWENDGEDGVGGVGSVGSKAVKMQVRSVRSRKAGGENVFLPKVHVKFEDAPGAEGPYFAPSEDEDLYDEFAGPVAQDAGPVARDAEPVARDAEPAIRDAETVIRDAGPETLCSGPRGVTKYKELSPELIAESGRLFVRNLAFTCTEADLTALFSRYGPVSETHIPLTRDTKQAKGFAYVLFAVPTDAVKAYAALDGTIFQGRLLHILPSEDARDKKHVDDAGSSSYQARKQAQLRAQAGSSHNWNSLFVRADTVLDAVAGRLGVPKSAIMNAHESDSLATRMAVAETHIIQETKEYLEGAGVCLDAFAAGAGGVERSSTIILVKNLCFASEEAELKALFARHGAIERFILPPLTKAIALVEFLEPVEAKAAFRALAYTNYRGAPLFLEWAPVLALRERAVQKPSVPVVDAVYEKEMMLSASASASAGASASASSSNTLYIKNLSFSTTEEGLRALFEGRLDGCRLRSVRIPRKADPKQQGQALSLGFGFVEFEGGDAWINRAIDELQGVLLDGHQLVLKRAEGVTSARAGPGTGAGPKAKAKPQPQSEAEESAKLLLKNIPFEASAHELRALITSFSGGLKRLRLPKKMDGQLRGFAFAEFVSAGEAKRVKDILAGTHFYGRHLVIEWSHVQEP